MTDESNRVTVSTYVPAHQRETWREEAESIGMSQSEFVRSMVQAGRRGFSFGSEAENSVEPDPSGSSPWGNGLKTDLLDVLRDRGPLEWDALVAELTGDIEDEIEDALAQLQDENRIRHSGRQGGYAIAEGVDGQ